MQEVHLSHPARLDARANQCVDALTKGGITRQHPSPDRETMMATITLNDKRLRQMSVEELEHEIQHHNRQYWDRDQPVIPDTEYDRLKRRLEELRPGSPVLQEMGPTETGRSGAPVVHNELMLSLDKCYSDKELDEWASRFEGDVLVTPKLDGIAASLRYDEHGYLYLAATRGSGRVGDDITANARTITDIPQHIEGSSLEVRGEIHMKQSVFKGFAKEFANARNLAAGAIKHKDPERCRAYQLSFAAYDLRGPEIEGERVKLESEQAESEGDQTELTGNRAGLQLSSAELRGEQAELKGASAELAGRQPQLTTEQAKLERLVALGFPRLESMLVTKSELRTAYAHFAAKRSKLELDFEIDGVVFKANSLAEQRRLGSTAHHPRYAIAYKFQGDSAVSTLRQVEWSVGRSGAITPVAIIDPVTLSGAAITRVSLHNAGYLRELELLGRPRGAQVTVTRRGGVIPHVEGLVGQELLALPTACPSCEGSIVTEGDSLYCANPAQCRAAHIGAIARYCKALEIRGFGDELLGQAYDAGLLRGPADLYTLTLETLAALEHVDEKAASNLLQRIAKRRTIRLATFLLSLGIEELGSQLAAFLEEQYGSLERVRALNVEDLATTHGIGSLIAETVVRRLAEQATLIEHLLAHVQISTGLPMAGRPKGQVQGDSAVTTLRQVDWSVDRSGAITPVAIVDPVTLSGEEITRVSLHNAGYLRKLKLLGRTPGARLAVRQRGGVSPHIEDVVGQELLELPKVCPSCEGTIVAERDLLYCSEPTRCRGAQIAAIAHYCQVIEILGFGDKLLEQTFDAGLLRSPADLYALTPEALTALEGGKKKAAKKRVASECMDDLGPEIDGDRVAAKRVSNLLQQIDSHREIDLATFVQALGIEEVGPQLAALLTEQYGSLERLRQASIEELSAIHSIGSVIAEKVMRGLAQQAPLIERLLAHVKISTAKPAEGRFTGQSFVFTGKLLAFERKVGQQRVRALGGETPSAVSKSLSYLVVGDGAEERASSKLKQARRYMAEGAALKIISEAEFLALVGEL